MGIVLKNGNVIDVENSKHSIKDIRILDDRILMCDHGLEIEDNDEVIDCTGKWILPGLVDMHCHIKEKYAPLFCASGVTTVRNTAGSVIELDKMRNAENKAITPRIISADRLIDGPPGLWGSETNPYQVITDNNNVARGEVQRQAKIGVDLIKVYGLLSGEVMAAVVEEAAKFNLDVACDLMYSTSVTAIDAANMGFKWIEHASGITQILYPNWSMKADKSVWELIDWENPNEAEIAVICQKLIEKDVYLCPTLVVYDQANKLEGYWQPDNMVIDKIDENQGLIATWQRILDAPQAINKMGIQTEIIKAVVKIYHELGGTIVAGSDSPAGIFTFPGMSLHRELELLVSCGFSTIEAIQAATIIAAKSLGRTELGSITQGKIADLLVLNSNPIEQIKNTKNIALIIKGGKVYQQKEIIEGVITDEEAIESWQKVMVEFEKNGLV